MMAEPNSTSERGNRRGLSKVSKSEMSGLRIEMVVWSMMAQIRRRRMDMSMARNR
jgi:hypothetical protein